MMEQGTFWGRDSYALPITKGGERNWQAWDNAMRAGLQKCPNIEKLVKFQKDNAISLDEYGKAYSASQKHMMEAFDKRRAELYQGPIE